MFSDKAGDEYAAVMKEGNELDNELSYMPYLSDMGLCQRSPYSASANPILHLTIHMTCAYLGSVRSQRSRIPGESGMMLAQVNAALMAYAFRTKSKLRLQYSHKPKKERAIRPRKDTSLTEENPLPTGLDECDWINWYTNNKDTLDPVVIGYCNKAGEKQETSEGTIGAWLKRSVL